AARRVDDSIDHRWCLLLRRHEDQLSLRQETRLEDAPPVLVGDPTLAAVADRLDHRDADVTGLLDRVDHGLDPFTDHDRLHLDPAQGPLLSSRTVSRQTPSSVPIRSRLPTTRKPQRSCKAMLATFSEKIDAWIVQKPASSASARSRPSSAVPTP